jgi:hypothetical protein
MSMSRWRRSRSLVLPQDLHLDQIDLDGIGSRHSQSAKQKPTRCGTIGSAVRSQRTPPARCSPQGSSYSTMLSRRTGNFFATGSPPPPCDDPTPQTSIHAPFMAPRPPVRLPCWLQHSLEHLSRSTNRNLTRSVAVVVHVKRIMFCRPETQHLGELPSFPAPGRDRKVSASPSWPS